MEIGSVLELENWSMYDHSQKEDYAGFNLPFAKKHQTGFNFVFFQSCRNALESLLIYLKNTRAISNVILPDFICSTVSDAVTRAGIKLQKYPIGIDYSFSFSDIRNKLVSNSCLYINHYFGNEISESNLRAVTEWQSTGGIVIEDVTMSLLSTNIAGGFGFGNYIIGSLRKWFAVPDGGFIFGSEEALPKQPDNTRVSQYTLLYFQTQIMKREYIEGGCRDANLKKSYLECYSRAIEILFSDFDCYSMSPISLAYLGNCDISWVIEKRVENHEFLANRLSGITGIRVISSAKSGFVPFGLVICVSDRDELVKYLIERDIYCTVHWRSVDFANCSGAEYLSSHCLTVPIDQRYGICDMERVSDEILQGLRMSETVI